MPFASSLSAAPTSLPRCQASSFIYGIFPLESYTGPALADNLRTMEHVPGVQLRTRRPLRVTLYWVICIVICGFFTSLLVSHLHQGFCNGPSLLASSNLCTSAQQSGWNLFYHLGGNGPWIRRYTGLYYHDAPLPKRCSINQAHLVSRG